MKSGFLMLALIRYHAALNEAGDSYVRMQTTLELSSDDMDDATRGNVANLKADAARLLKTHKPELEKVCATLLAR